MKDPMLAIMADFDPDSPLEAQLHMLMRRYKERTGREADVLFVHPDTLAKLPIDELRGPLSIRAYYIVAPHVLCVGEAME